MSLQITLIRHGKVNKTLPNHREHPLSAEGMCQALNRRIALGHPQFDLVCHSTLARTKETALLVSNSTNRSMVKIPSLFWEEGDPRGHDIEALFGRLGNASLSEYCTGAGAAIMSLARDSYVALTNERKKIAATNILVVGHAVMTQALGRVITEIEEPFMSFVCGECEGFRITMSDLEHVLSIDTLNLARG